MAFNYDFIPEHCASEKEFNKACFFLDEGYQKGLSFQKQPNGAYTPVNPNALGIKESFADVCAKFFEKNKDYLSSRKGVVGHILLRKWSKNVDLAPKLQGFCNLLVPKMPEKEQRTGYVGFGVVHKPSSGLSYYEEARKAALSAPITPAQKQEFDCPLNKWGEFCNANRAERRAQYRVNEYFDLPKVEAEALLTLKIKRSDGKEVKVILAKQDVSQIEADATVNAANETLLGGGGCDKRIHDGAGPLLVRECATIKGGCNVGDAKITKGYNLPANYVIHTVGPLLIDNVTPDEKALASCYKSCLKISEAQGHKSIVFPCVATGFYAFPMELSSQVVAKTIMEFIKTDAKSIDTIILSLPEQRKFEPYLKTFKALESPQPVAASSKPPSEGVQKMKKEKH